MLTPEVESSGMQMLTSRFLALSVVYDCWNSEWNLIVYTVLMMIKVTVDN